MNTNIEGLIKKFNMMPKSKEKFCLYETIDSYLNYLKYAHSIDDKKYQSLQQEMLDTENMEQKIDKLIAKINNDICSNIPFLNSIYKNILSNANKYPLYFTSYPNAKHFIHYAEEFFKLMGDDVYSVYQKIVNNKTLSKVVNYYDGGSCFSFLNGNSGIILKENTNYVYQTICLVHEMGHAYDDYLNKDYHYNHLHPISDEVLSTTFEHLFIYFLTECNVFKNKEQYICYRSFITQRLLLMNCALIYNNLTSINAYTVKDRLYVEDYGIIQSDLIYDFYDNVDEYANTYSMGLMCSCILKEHFIKNPSETLKEIKELAVQMKKDTTDEIIRYFSKTEYLNATNKTIHKVMCKK